MGLKVIIFGASGMVGRGVLLECLDRNEIDKVIMVNRASIGVEHNKLEEVIHSDFTNYEVIIDKFKDLDVCYWTLGISAVGLSEEKYHHVTYDFTVTAAKEMHKLNPQMSFMYVSGVGTDSTEKGRIMWARVKGKTENALLNLGFKGAYMFRPGYIQPERGIKSKTALYNTLYIFFKPLFPIMKALSPNKVTTTTRIGNAMINLTLNRPEDQILEPKEINFWAEYRN